MFSHIFLGVTDFDRALAFYGPVLQTLGIAARFCEPERPWAGWQLPGTPRPLLLIGRPFDQRAHAAGNGQMVALLADSRAAVRAAFDAALAHGGVSDGAPGLRPEYHANYYGAYFRDPDGNKLCVACHAAEPDAASAEPGTPSAVMPPFAVRRIDHLVLRVRDIEASIAFYRELLGCAVVKRRDDLGLVHLRAGVSMLDLVAIDGPLGREGGAAPAREGRNLDHLCLRIEPFDAAAIRAHLAAHAVPHDANVHLNFGAEGDGPSIYFSDPDGNPIELKGPAAV